MSVALCDVCQSPIITPIPFEPIADSKYSYFYPLSDHFDCPAISFHLKNMYLIGYTPVVRCSACGTEDDLPSHKIFTQLAHIKIFQAYPHGVTLKLMREHFGLSQADLASRLGYGTTQTIYRFEHAKTPISGYLRAMLVSLFLDYAQMYTPIWHHNLELWQREVELDGRKRIIVPMPVKLLLPFNPQYVSMPDGTLMISSAAYAI